jgi:2-keto-3-deoxy-L-rhamnonate aldolase RhmA
VFLHVDNAKIAAELFDFCCYSPNGRCSISGTLPSLDFESFAQKDTAAAINDATLLVFMLEAPETIINSNAIATLLGDD